MRRKVWVYNPRKGKRTISDQTKNQIQLVCDQFIEEYLRPRFVRPFDPKNKTMPQCIDIRWKWYRHFIHFMARYKDTRRDVIEEEYDYPIARLEYTHEDLFYLAYFRHTGEWSDMMYDKGNSLEECLGMIRELPHFEIL